MGEHELQRLIAEALRPMIERWFAQQRTLAHVGADQFFYWAEGDSSQRIAPDVYVVPDVPQNPPVASWKLWESSARPSFALEVVGQDIDKDYDDNPVLYRALGLDELVLFDPHATPRSRRRLRWQVFRKLRARGLVRTHVFNGDRVHSRALGCWLRELTVDGRLTLRLATGEQGDDLIPTELEAERAAREQAEATAAAERSAREQAEAIAAAERSVSALERAAREQAEAELARLRAALAALEDKRRR